MKHIYCISGFGADERVFSKLNFETLEFHFLPWLDPVKNESIESYAKRMSEGIIHADPVLLGLSFGGIMSIEIAKLVSTSKIILISSIKTFREMPLWMRLTGKLKLDKAVPLKTFTLIEPIENYNLGIENKEELKLVREYRTTISQQYTNWATHRIINWRNEWIPPNLVHIHGGSDHIFPIKNSNPDYVIPGGGHFMIMNRAAEVNDIIKKVLE
jgi:pimeloyl-ACP methyl ester carboxylesterase